MQDLLDDIERWRAAGDRIAVARVVDVEGSGPRGPGAAMAVTESGEVAGSVSGGCVEGAVVAEALAVGVPALTTTGAPWELLNRERCGWWIDIGVAPLVAALREATELDDGARHAMGQRGRTYVREHLSWERVAEEMLAAYRWLLDHGDRPEMVVMA